MDDNTRVTHLQQHQWTPYSCPLQRLIQRIQIVLRYSWCIISSCQINCESATVYQTPLSSSSFPLVCPTTFCSNILSICKHTTDSHVVHSNMTLVEISLIWVYKISNLFSHYYKLQKFESWRMDKRLGRGVRFLRTLNGFQQELRRRMAPPSSTITSHARKFFSNYYLWSVL